MRAHPIFANATALACLRAVVLPRTRDAPVLKACIKHHAAALGLAVYTSTPAFHLVLSPGDQHLLVLLLATVQNHELQTGLG